MNWNRLFEGSFDNPSSITSRFAPCTRIALEAFNAPSYPRERSLAFIIDRLYRCHAELSGKSIAKWGDKTPANVYSMAEIIAVFPQAKFVHLVRNGLDVVPSMLLQGGMADDVRLPGNAGTHPFYVSSDSHGPTRLSAFKFDMRIWFEILLELHN